MLTDANFGLGPPSKTDSLRRRMRVTFSVRRMRVTSSVRRMRATSSVRRMRVTSSARRTRVTSLARRMRAISLGRRTRATFLGRRMRETSSGSPRAQWVESPSLGHGERSSWALRAGWSRDASAGTSGRRRRDDCRGRLNDSNVRCRPWTKGASQSSGHGNRRSVPCARRNRRVCAPSCATGVGRSRLWIGSWIEGSWRSDTTGIC